MKPDALCFEALSCGKGAQAGVRLLQAGKDNFTVRYGLQVKARLTYEQAATELGACLMHALACDGKLDNREKGES